MLILELSVEEINGILAALSKLPFEQVVDLISKIKAQAIPQLEQNKKEDEPKPVKQNKK